MLLFNPLPPDWSATGLWPKRTQKGVDEKGHGMDTFGGVQICIITLL